MENASLSPGLNWQLKMWCMHEERLVFMAIQYLVCFCFYHNEVSNEKAGKENL